MKQIITGPFGCVAYHNTGVTGGGQYPELNIPCNAFARGEMPQAANQPYTLNVIQLPRRSATLAMFGTHVKRKI